MLQAMIKERNLPALSDRKTMLDILLREEYGNLPPKPEQVEWQVEEDCVKNFCAGKARLNRITMHCRFGEKAFSFPFHFAFPTAQGKHPFFVHINFRSDVPDRYMPTEELIDHGFAVFSFCYHDVTRDNGDFTNGLAGVLYENGRRKADSAGKIAMWAWAAQRILDYALTLDDILDLDTAVVCGHSRLGKTALLAAATDERFSFAYSNDSGCSGAAITRNKQGETVEAICQKFSYWFCENYNKYRNNEEKMPFDQHFLISAIAPRKVLVGSASEDIWADPVAEQLCCAAASPAFEKGFICNSFPAKVGEAFLEGDIGYHLREGLHYFSRQDWHRLMEFVELHRSV